MARPFYDVVHVGSVPEELGARKHSGLGHVVWGLARSQVRGSGLSVAIAARGAYYRGFQRREGVDIYGVGVSPGAFFRALALGAGGWREWARLRGKDRLRYAYALYFMSRILGRMECGLLHVHHVSNFMARAARAWGYRGPVVAHVHSYSNLVQAGKAGRAYRLATLNRLLADADAVIHTSHHAREQGRELGVRHEASDRVVYNGIEVEEGVGAGGGARGGPGGEDRRPKPDHSVCFVGAFLPIKGVRRLLDALALLDPPDLPVAWVGAGPLEGLIRRRCAELGIAFEVTGLVPKREALERMRRSRVLVVPSRSESFGQVYLQALVQGTPVVGFAGTLSEFAGVLGLRGGAWLQPYDHEAQSPEELRDMIVRGLEHAYEPREHGRIREGIRDRFGWSTVTGEVRGVYRSLQDGDG